MCQLALRFEAKRFFPLIEADKILEISYELAKFFNCSPFGFDDVDFFEFNWMYEKLITDMEQQKPGNQQSIMALANMMGQ